MKFIKRTVLLLSVLTLLFNGCASLSGYPYRLSDKACGSLGQMWFKETNSVFVKNIDQNKLTVDEKDIIRKKGIPNAISANAFNRNADIMVWAYLSDKKAYVFDKSGKLAKTGNLTYEDVIALRKYTGMPDFPPLKALMIEPIVSKSNNFADDDVKVSFTLQEDNVSFTIQNKTSEAMKCIWDESSFIDINGNSKRVYHEGVRNVDRNAPQTPTIIPPNTSITDTIVPTENVDWGYNNWIYKPLFPGLPDAYIGKTFGVFLTLIKGGKEKNYTFRFKIE